MREDTLETEPTAEETVARATETLGEPEALFRTSRRRLRAKYFAGIGLIAFGVIATGLWFGIGPARAEHIVLHILFWPPAIGMGLLVHLRRHGNRQVLLYPTGILHLQGRKATSFLWDEITSIKARLDFKGEPQIERDRNDDITSVWLPSSAPAFQVWNVWLELEKDGATARFTGALEDFPELVENVQISTFPLLYAKALAQLERGEAVSFGDKLSADREAVHFGKVSIAWNAMKLFGFTGKFLMIKKQGAWISGIAKEIGQIENLHVLLALAANHGVLKIEDDAD